MSGDKVRLLEEVYAKLVLSAVCETARVASESVAPRSWAERAYPKLMHYNKLDKGGHFAAWEQPQLFSEELRAGFRSLR